ncbi:MAG: hypothetical protein ACYTGB_00520 [Planctomycetota bacterium]|jgi:hypothetical protein
MRRLLVVACLLVSGCLAGAEAPPAVGEKASPAAGEPFKVGAQVKEIPAWAEKELAAFAAVERCYRDFMKRYTKPDGSTVVTARCSHGNIDDIIEGFFKWDKFVLLAASDELREQYVRVWKYHWNYGTEKGWFENGFYVKGYDAEHAGELLPMLWACVELRPDDRELTSVNEATAKVLTSPEWFHPERHLFRYSFVRSRPIDEAWRKKYLEPRWVGECGVNTVYAGCVWLAHLTSGQEKYRRWVLDYCTAWNRAAAANKGVFPYHIDTPSGKLGPGGDGRWWAGSRHGDRGGTSSFDYARYGMVTPTRGLRNLPVAAAFLDGGEEKHAAGLVSTVKALFANAKDGLPVAAYDPEQGGWFRGKKWPHHIPVLLDKAFVLTWDPDLRKLMDSYPVEKVRWLEQEFAEWCRFTYCGRGGLEVAEKAFDRAKRRAERRMEKAAALKEPKKGDDLTEVTLERVCDFAYVDGAQWGGHNARCGGPSPGPVGYFDERGRRGLPPGVAALVRNVDEGSVTLLVCNTGGRPVRLLVTGGYYGQHMIGALSCAQVKARLNARRVLLELPAKGLAEVKLGLTRCALKPTLKPQTAEGR